MNFIKHPPVKKIQVREDTSSESALPEKNAATVKNLHGIPSHVKKFGVCNRRPPCITSGHAAVYFTEPDINQPIDRMHNYKADPLRQIQSSHKTSEQFLDFNF